MMKPNDILRIGIAGAGQMGTGIAQIAAASGWQVLLLDVRESALQAAVARIRDGLTRSVEKGALKADLVEPSLVRIRTTGRLDDFVEAQLIIEAAPEIPSLKLDLFRQMGRVCKPETVLASNTSSISITKLGAASGRPDRVVGMHFMNPVPVMRLVEVVRGMQTADESVDLVIAVGQRMGKTPVVCTDSPGFIVNRILAPMINEATFLLEEGHASAEAIDLAMTAGTNHPMGPLALADRIGLDTVLAILEVLHHDFGDPKFRPCPMLRKYVEAGWLGRKSGRGFYNYEARS